jgi:hypothetical protein
VIEYIAAGFVLLKGGMMDKKRMEHAFNNAFTQGIFYALGFTLVDIFYKHAKGKFLLISIILNFCWFILFTFIWGYFEYPSFVRRRSSFAPKEFRCFKCEALIPPNETKCSKCGWTWDKTN